MSKDLGIPAGFRGMGAKEEDIPTLAENAMKDACAATSPRTAKLQEVQEVIDIIQGAM
jgi:alcohol dehydrogenase